MNWGEKNDDQICVWRYKTLTGLIHWSATLTNLMDVAFTAAQQTAPVNMGHNCQTWLSGNIDIYTSIECFHLHSLGERVHPSRMCLHSFLQCDKTERSLFSHCIQHSIANSIVKVSNSDHCNLFFVLCFKCLQFLNSPLCALVHTPYTGKHKQLIDLIKRIL